MLAAHSRVSLAEGPSGTGVIHTNLLIISLFLTGNRAAEPFLGCAVFYALLRFVQKFIWNDVGVDAHIDPAGHSFFPVIHSAFASSSRGDVGIAPYVKIKRCAKDVTQ